MKDFEPMQKTLNFFSSQPIVRYKKGEILVSAGEQPTGIFYLKEGTVKMYCISDKGEEVVLNIFKPESFFPMSWAVNNMHNLYFFEAEVDSELYISPKNKVIDFIKENPDVLFDLLSRMYSGLEGMLLRMSHLMSGTARTRLILELTIAAERFGQSNGDEIVLTISEKELAMRTGLTKETVSREMSLLKRAGLVQFQKKRLDITSLKKLRNALHEEV